MAAVGLGVLRCGECRHHSRIQPLQGGGVYLYLGMGVDQPNPLRHRTGLGAAQISQAALVTAEVLDREEVVIDQQKAPHTTAGQIQGRQAPHRAATTDDHAALRHRGGLQQAGMA